AAAGLGAKVALIEQKGMGGDCLNVGCVPSKALLEYTRRTSSPSFDDAFTWLRSVRESIAINDSVDRYLDHGVDVFLGSGEFIDGQTVQVGKNRLKTRRTVIATGSRPILPNIPGLIESEPLTNESIFDLIDPPKRLAILGAGAVGCELAQALACLGIEINLFEMADTILPMAHKKASAEIARSLIAKNVQLHTKCQISEIRHSDTKITVVAGSTKTTVDKILVAAGRQANTETLCLEKAGVKIQNGLIAVDNKLRTTNPRVLAAGDVCSLLKYTHNADAHARIVVQNALFAPTATTTNLIIPHCTYTNPEVSSVGKTSQELQAEKISYDVYRVELGDLDRSQTEGDKKGFVEVLTNKGGDKILGATILARDAGEQITPICIAMANSLGLKEIGKATIPYPTRGEYVKRLADTYNRTRITPAANRLIKTWFRFTS
ncbi:MAG: FAD-dependent oxidoreductase, partial [Gammaproteobacteria bacterium]|nr:FAD-dependent oxidoreductase [Gammaproteobacteria bacterium]